MYKYLSLVYWSMCALYFRTLTFFSVANPKIYLGGMLDERKSDIYKLIPPQYLPKTLLIKKEDSLSMDAILESMTMPVIVKPDIGYKGHKVKKIDAVNELMHVLENSKDNDLLVQEFLDEPREYSIMYYRIPSSEEFGITSLVEKHLPFVKGDGYSSIGQLIQKLENPFLDKQWVENKLSHRWNDILPEGDELIVDHIGNYARGSKFENLSHEIDEALINSVHGFFQQVPGVNFARLDLKSDSLDTLRSGTFRILEVNGAKSEPIHIYDPRLSFFDVFREISKHWMILFKIVKGNIKNMDIPSSMEGLKSYWALKKMMDS